MKKKHKKNIVLRSNVIFFLYFRVECVNCGPGVSFSPSSETIQSTFIKVQYTGAVME